MNGLLTDWMRRMKRIWVMMMTIMVPYSPKDVGVAVYFGGPFRLAAVAFAVVGRHDGVLCVAALVVVVVVLENG